MYKPLATPKGSPSLMALAGQSASQEQEHKQRSTSATSNLSQLSVESTASDLLDAKIAEMESELDYIRSVRDRMTEAREVELISHDKFQQELAPFLRSFRTSSKVIRVVKRQRQLIIEDLDEEIASKRQRTDGPSDQGLLERAYRDTIIARVLGATAKQKSVKFDQRAFRKAVRAYYGINEHCLPGFSYCHVLNTILPEASVKAAHLVPKSMTREELSHLFGVEDAVLADPRNGITLSENVELLLDKGTIAIVPLPGPLQFPTEWRCVVLDESKNDDVIGVNDGKYIRLKEIDNKKLKFLTTNRPRRRYLYFCFIIAYLHAKRRGANDEIARKVEATRFWPSGGDYLNRSTLITLARCVSGSDLPSSLAQENTFDGHDDSTRDADAGTVLGADVREAILAMENL